MSDFEILRQMDIKEVQKATRLTITRLQQVVNKSFDELDRVKAYGFIRIIERECGLNLSDWISEYNEHCKKQDKRDQRNDHSHTTSSGQRYDKDSDSKLIYAPTTEIVDGVRPNKLRLAVFSSAFLVISIVSYALYSMLSIQSPEETQAPSAPFASHSDMRGDHISLPGTQPGSQLTDANVLDHSEFAQPGLVVDDKPKMYKIIVTPRSDLWMGFVNLKTSKIQEKIIPANISYEIYVQDRTVYKFGHTHFDLNVDGVRTSYSHPRSSRFIYDPSDGFRQLTPNQFNSLVGGNLWQ